MIIVSFYEYDSFIFSLVCLVTLWIFRVVVVDCGDFVVVICMFDREILTHSYSYM